MGRDGLTGNRNGLIEEMQRHFPEGMSKSTKYLNHLPGVPGWDSRWTHLNYSRSEKQSFS